MPFYPRVLVFHKNKKNFLKKVHGAGDEHGLSWKSWLATNHPTWFSLSYITVCVCVWVCVAPVCESVQLSQSNIHLTAHCLCTLLMCEQNRVWLNGSCAQLWLRARIHVIMWLRGNYISLQVQWAHSGYLWCPTHRLWFTVCSHLISKWVLEKRWILLEFTVEFKCK